MREAQAYAKNWKRKMRSNINDEAQVAQYQNYNKHFGEVFDMINEEQEAQYGSDNEEDEEAKHEPKKKAGFFGKLGDKISAKLYKASKITGKKLQE